LQLAASACTLPTLNDGALTADGPGHRLRADSRVRRETLSKGWVDPGAGEVAGSSGVTSPGRGEDPAASRACRRSRTHRAL
jgi:hypothetical protein